MTVIVQEGNVGHVAAVATVLVARSLYGIENLSLLLVTEAGARVVCERD